MISEYLIFGDSYTCMLRRTMMQTRDRIASLYLISAKCSNVPNITSRNAFALKDNPKSGFICVEHIVKAALEVKAEMTGVEMKLTMNPNPKS
jgi:hypothetical protein